MNGISRALLLALLISSSVEAGSQVRSAMPAGSDTIAAAMTKALDDELARWYPLCLDSLYGGYFSDMNYKWDLQGRQDKMIVTQARHIWSASMAAMYSRKYRNLLGAAAHGVSFLKKTMWDHQYGGFYTQVTRTGEPLKVGPAAVKTAYGNAFAIYGLSAYYKASGDTSALNLALETYRWLEKNSYDPRYGGYFQFLSREGSPYMKGFQGTPPKDQNSMIHLLESFTTLYDIWPDSVLRLRLESLLRIVRDTLTTGEGYLNLFFERDWTPISYRDSSAASRRRHFEFDHISFGHDIETAYLMLDASEALGLRDDSTTLALAKKKVDAALRGFDAEKGGLFDGGYEFAPGKGVTIVLQTKEWWAQVEALNSLLMMSVLYPQDSLGYFDKFLKQWDFCRKYLIDYEHGGWYWGGTDQEPRNIYSPKGSIWKADYHTSRAMINCIRRLHNIFPGERRFAPVDPDATPEAKSLLQYLYDISGKHILSGQHNYVSLPDTFPGRVQTITGKLPMVWGCDFIEYYKPGNAAKLVQEAYAKYKQGYIITLMWHAGRPQDDPPFGWKESMQGRMTDAEWDELTTPGSALNHRWERQADTVASYLKDLQALGVPVLWRPYHEQNGVWFWWGNRKGQQGAARLYRMMFERFVRVHHLNNLLWVWDTSAPRRLFHDEAYAYEDFFPGLECVDVLAADIYHSDFKQVHHDELCELAQGKVIALGEVGEVPSPVVLTMQPGWTWFMIWGNFVDTHNSPQQIRALYDDERVITHETQGARK
ncbi:MAG TPA: glycosyl hydrolase [Bacteroidota bacterium]|nr:glycosyl hydrolase [Bacteroidota bacterium]